MPLHTVWAALTSAQVGLFGIEEIVHPDEQRYMLVKAVFANQ